MALEDLLKCDDKDLSDAYDHLVESFEQKKFSDTLARMDQDHSATMARFRKDRDELQVKVEAKQRTFDRRFNDVEVKLTELLTKRLRQNTIDDAHELESLKVHVVKQQHDLKMHQKEYDDLLRRTKHGSKKLFSFRREDVRCPDVQALEVHKEEAKARIKNFVAENEEVKQNLVNEIGKQRKANSEADHERRRAIFEYRDVTLVEARQATVEAQKSELEHAAVTEATTRARDYAKLDKDLTKTLTKRSNDLAALRRQEDAMETKAATLSLDLEARRIELLDDEARLTTQYKREHENFVAVAKTQDAARTVRHRAALKDAKATGVEQARVQYEDSLKKITEDIQGVAVSCQAERDVLRAKARIAENKANHAESAALKAQREFAQLDASNNARAVEEEEEEGDDVNKKKVHVCFFIIRSSRNKWWSLLGRYSGQHQLDERFLRRSHEDDVLVVLDWKNYYN